MVLRRPRPVPYKEREADAEDVLLLIAVADSSLAYDRSTKLRLYAEAGIPEYWVIDCNAEIVEVYRDPGAGSYRDRASCGRRRGARPPGLPRRRVDRRRHLRVASAEECWPP